MQLFALDGTLVVQLLNFAIFFALLSGVFLRPVSQAVRERREFIGALASDYAKYQHESEQLRRQADAVRAAARRDGERALAKARADASNRAGDVTGEYARQAQAVVEEAHARAAGELELARAGEDGLVRSLADEMLRRGVPELHA